MVKKKNPRINNIIFNAIGLFQLYELHVSEQHEPVRNISSRPLDENETQVLSYELEQRLQTTVTLSVRLLHSFVN